MSFYLVFLLLILFLFALSLDKRGAYYKSQIFFFIFIIISCIASIRFDVGWDYRSYYQLLENRDPHIDSMEPLSSLFFKISFWFPPYFIFIIYAVPTYFIIYLTFKRFSYSLGLSTIIYLSLIYLNSLCIIRQGLAMSICLFGYSYIKERKVYKYILCIIIGCLFHYSAIVCLFIYPIYHYGSLKRAFIFCIILIISKPLTIYLVLNYTTYGRYFEIIDEQTGGKLVQFFYFLLFISIFIIIKHSNFKDEEQKMMKIILFAFPFPFIFGAALGGRLSSYLNIYYCLFIPLLLQNKYNYKRLIYITIFSIYFLLTVFYSSNIDNQRPAYTPYRTIFSSSYPYFYN